MTSIDTWDPWVAIIFIGTPGLLAIAGTGYSLLPEPLPPRRHKGGLKEQPLYLSLGAELREAGLDLVPIGNFENCRNGYVVKGIYPYGRCKPCRSSTFPASSEKASDCRYGTDACLFSVADTCSHSVEAQVIQPDLPKVPDRSASANKPAFHSFKPWSLCYRDHLYKGETNGRSHL
ncbi:hypothetical protein C4K03_1652 [Pseudomonas synxantha]|uniref:Uncharacterized protein n=1 Tax=Pseudomonas synxantha TaxID=47883 RepID=A0A3G7U368_9PSED|nr:hypothetical protein C4K03_1652 [Pseudomonas synxantha]